MTGQTQAGEAVDAIALDERVLARFLELARDADDVSAIVADALAELVSSSGTLGRAKIYTAVMEAVSRDVAASTSTTSSANVQDQLR